MEGKPEEIKQILSFYTATSYGTSSSKKPNKKYVDKRAAKKIEIITESNTDIVVEMVNSIKESDNAQSIEENILDRSSQIDRVLLPLYINYKYHGNKFSLTTGDISKILTELGVPINIGNISNAIKTSASKYVVGDKARKQGQAVKYKLSRRGVQYMSSVVEEGSNDN